MISAQSAVNRTGDGRRRLDGTTAIVTGASRGFGRAIAAALCNAGAHVVGVARSARDLRALRAELGPSFTGLAADAAEPSTATHLIDEFRPRTIVLCAGAAPLMAPLTQQTWDSFSQNWNVDVAQGFHWIRHALLSPLEPGSRVIAVSSGAALKGSPLSGGYAGAKATVRFLTDYAAHEAEQRRSGIEFVSILPGLTPSTALGTAAVSAYAAQQGVTVEMFAESLAPILTAEQAATSIRDLAMTPVMNQRAYLLSASGLAELSGAEALSQRSA